MTKATIQRPNIQRYIIARPHQPFPSAIRVNVPIRLPAASMPVVFRSNPSITRERMDFSDSRLDRKVCDEVLSWVARDKSDSVRVSCSARSWLRAVSVACVLEGKAAEKGGDGDLVNADADVGLGTETGIEEPVAVAAVAVAGWTD